MRESSLENPLTDAEVDEANHAIESLYIHVKCKLCGEVEPCFNRSQVAWQKKCFPCLMGWTEASQQ